MATLLYSAITSLDGYVEDADGGFGWAEPSDEVHAHVNDLMRTVGTHLYGRRMYRTLAPWETDPALAAHSPVARDFAAAWQKGDKVVYSTTLEAPVTARTRVERAFDPAAVRDLLAATGGAAVIGGATLAAQAFRAGLVDEVLLYVVPVAVGGGKPALPRGVRLHLELSDERRFADGTIYLRYRCS